MVKKYMSGLKLSSDIFLPQKNGQKILENLILGKTGGKMKMLKLLLYWKDNIPFHAVIWPAMLSGYGDLNLPTNVPANQYILIKGEKKKSFSK